MAPRTMFEKIWDAHVVHEEPGQPSLIYIDLHLVHEVTSPQAFDGLRMAGRKVRRPDLTVATADHNTPTWELTRPIEDQISKAQLDALDRNAAEFELPFYYDRFSENQGIVHVIGPDLGYTLPGKTVVCGDSHTSTHGALGCFAVGIGTSEVEHVLATQTLRQFKPRTMEVRVDGQLPNGVSAKDVILGIIGHIGVNGGTGHVIEYTGEAIRGLSMDGRMTICNMSIEGGARAGMIAPDDTTFDYVRTRPYAPKGAELEARIEEWRSLPTDSGATYDNTVVINATDLAPFVTWGTQARHGSSRHRPCARSCLLRDHARARGRRARPGVHGPGTQPAHRGHSDRPRVPGRLHQRPHRRPPRRRQRHPRPPGQFRRVRHGGSRFRPGEGGG